MLTQELAILLGEPVPQPTRLFQFTFEPTLALARSLLAGTGSTAPRNPGEQPGNPTEDTDRGHGSPQEGVQSGNLFRLHRRIGDPAVRILPWGRQGFRR